MLSPNKETDLKTYLGKSQNLRPDSNLQSDDLFIVVAGQKSQIKLRGTHKGTEINFVVAQHWP